METLPTDASAQMCVQLLAFSVQYQKEMNFEDVDLPIALDSQDILAASLKKCVFEQPQRTPPGL